MFKLFLLSLLVIPNLKADVQISTPSIVEGKASAVSKNTRNHGNKEHGLSIKERRTHNTSVSEQAPLASELNATLRETVRTGADAIGGALRFLRDSSLNKDAEVVPENVSDPITQCTNSFLDVLQPCEGNSSPVMTSLAPLLEVVERNNISNKNMSLSTYSDNYCACIDRKVREEHYMVISENEIEAKLKEEKDKLNDMILTAVGVKFLNSYAGNMEDVQFFITTNVNVFGEDVEASRGLQCNKASDYEAEVEAVCSENNVSREESEKRIAHIMNSLGDNHPEKSLTERFAQLEHDVLNIKVKSPNTKKSAETASMVTREMFDKLRYSASQESPEVDFLDQFAYEVLNDRKLKAQLNEQIDGGRSPGHAIISILKDSQNSDFLQRYFAKNQKNESVARLKDLYGNEELFTKELLDIYKVAIDYHPGIKAMFRDSELFRKIKPIKVDTRLGSRPSLVQGMDKSPEILNEHFKQRCQTIKSRFAQAVCAPSSNFISLANRDDLNNLLKGKQGSFNPVFKDLLLCQNRTTRPLVAKAGVFEDLEFHRGDDINRSEYYDRKRNRTTSFAAYATAISTNSNIELKQELRSLTAKHEDKIRPTFRPEQNYEPKNYAAIKEALISEIPTISSTKAADKFRATEEPHAVSSTSVESTFHAASSTLATQTAAFTTPVMSQNNEKSPVADENKIREQIKEYLGSNYKEVDQHLSNTKDSDLTELMKLKEELAKDRQKIAELMREADQQKIKSLESTFKQLETRYNEAVKSKETERARIDRSNQSGDFSNTSLAENKTNLNETKNLAQANPEINSRTPASTQPASVASAGSRAAGASSAMTDRSAPASTAAKDSYRGDIVVTSSEVQSGSPKDPSQELIKYVTQNQLDIQTLLQLKESGLTYKYRTVENGREIEKEMKIDYASLTPEAKAVLEKQIATGETEKQKELDRLEQDYIAARRAYSFSTLKMILGIEAQKQQSVAN